MKPCPSDQLIHSTTLRTGPEAVSVRFIGNGRGVASIWCTSVALRYCFVATKSPPTFMGAMDSVPFIFAPSADMVALMENEMGWP